MSDRTFYLVRHGVSILQENGRVCLGKGSDPPLAPSGFEQIEKLMETSFFRRVKSVKAVYCSPLLRSKQTAVVLAEGMREIRVESGLSEMDMGLWEGMHFKQIEKEFPLQYALRGLHPSVPPPAGETFAEAASRMEETLFRMMEAHPKEKKFLVVVHTGIASAFLCHIANKDFDENRGCRLTHCGHAVVKYRDGGFEKK
ncbi:histidine phosphatase family protein [Anaerotruncus sp. 80]|uniref:Histidine phosphatase family protein n=1 Tax=Anaerotruncus colihominis TaxID=169435 RepID=A0A845QF83_9FIRM|nr:MULTISPECIES: histidine phosphatase family protein [Anaerotruncus]NBH60139.1 histidine phosphatase family protein [Anaerotruncus colihominis]NCF00793.1 histidine phosphatase family protein [Anaerotruncus sp. 80]